MTDMGMDTVEMMTNFDGNEQEPAVLPSRLPVSEINKYANVCYNMPQLL